MFMKQILIRDHIFKKNCFGHLVQLRKMLLCLLWLRILNKKLVKDESLLCDFITAIFAHFKITFCLITIYLIESKNFSVILCTTF